MLKVGIIRLDIGRAASSDLSSDYILFCERTTKSLFNQDTIVIEQAKNGSLALTIDQITNNSSIIYGKFISRAKQWISDVDIIIIDINDPIDLFVPGRADLHMAAAINSLQQTYDSNYNKYFLILRKNIPSQETIYLNYLIDIKNAGKLITLSDEGHISDNNLNSSISQDEYKLDRISIKGSPLELLKARIIRRRGHFHNINGGLQSFFFDGQNCQKELFLLITEFINDKFSGRKPILIYHSTISSWLDDPVQSVAHSEKLNLRAYKATESLFVENPTVNIADDDNVLLIVPRTHTGNTIRDLINEINKINDKCSIDVLAIVSTQTSDQTSSIISVENKEYSVTCFCIDNTANDIIHYEDKCPLCETRKIPAPAYDISLYARLTSFEFHLMALESGWIQENDVPLGRKAIGQVPNFIALLHSNGTFIAYKLLQLLRFYVGSDFPAKPFLIVHPDQEGVSVIGSYLKLLHTSITVIKVPNSELDNQRNHPESQVIDSEAQWCKQLRSSDPEQSVVLMEEFIKSGGTRTAMKNLMRAVSKRINCHISLADFSNENNALNGIASYSLYKLPLE